MDDEALTREAIREVEDNGIVFLDEIDKICAREGGAAATFPRGRAAGSPAADRGDHGGDQARAGETDHVLFIASGAFTSRSRRIFCPSSRAACDRVELQPLTVEDFKQILTATEASLIKQTLALMETEGVTLDFTEDSIDALAASRWR